MRAFRLSGGWDKLKNHFLVWPHKDIKTEEDAKKVEMTTVNGSTRCFVAKMKNTE